MITDAKVIHISTGEECKVIEVIFDRIVPWIRIRHGKNKIESMSYPRFIEDYRKE